MRTTKEITVMKTVTAEVFCNKCSLTCRSAQDDFHYNEEDDTAHPFYGLIEAEVAGHYYSPALDDCKNYRFSLCEKCLKEMFATFKIPPTTKDYL